MNSVLTYVLNIYTSIMTHYRVTLLECMSYGNDFIMSKELLDDLSHETYDGGGYRALVRLAGTIIGSCERYGFFEEYMSHTLFIYMLPGNLMH